MAAVQSGPGTETDPPVSEEEIRLRAYAKYCARGYAPGDPVRDWLEAERELREEKRRLANRAVTRESRDVLPVPPATGRRRTTSVRRTS